tara:strand:+ start:2677 stop:3084 length:408 start_codon:yes stop_codon:yes gene_type:complete
MGFFSSITKPFKSTWKSITGESEMRRQAAAANSRSTNAIRRSQAQFEENMARKNAEAVEMQLEFDKKKRIMDIQDIKRKRKFVHASKARETALITTSGEMGAIDPKASGYTRPKKNKKNNVSFSNLGISYGLGGN